MKRQYRAEDAVETMLRKAAEAPDLTPFIRQLRPEDRPAAARLCVRLADHIPALQAPTFRTPEVRPEGPIMKRISEAYLATGMTLQELGLKMGYPHRSARTSAWQFLNHTTDPSLRMVRRFAKAVGVPVVVFLA